jgi:hypothetical protein
MLDPIKQCRMRKVGIKARQLSFGARNRVLDTGAGFERDLAGAEHIL